MAIWPNFTTFRHHFSVTGTPDPLTGYEEWPNDYVRINSFTTFNLPRPITQPSFTVTVNPASPGDLIGADDAVAGTDEYNWYVAMRTDDTARQHLSVSQVANKSGTLQFGVTSVAEDLIPNVDGTTHLDEIDLHLLYRNVWIYVQRVSDDAVQLIELLTASAADL